jgi:hypothetical protein
MRLLLICLVMSSAPALAGALVNKAAATYRPTASIDGDSVCGRVVESANDEYFAEESEAGLTSSTFLPPTFKSIPLESLEDLGRVEDAWRKHRYLLSMNGKKLFVGYENYGGCGGGCETEGFEFRTTEEAKPLRTPALMGWSLSSDGTRWYAVGRSRETVSVFRLDDAEPREVCHISIGVPDPSNSDDPDIAALVPKLINLNQAIRGVSRGWGDCGTLGSAARLDATGYEAVQMLVYRPWALSADVPVDDLEIWSLQGISEFESLNLLKQQLFETRDLLAAFYLKKRLVSNAAQANALATRAVSGAVGASFWFGVDYDTEGLDHVQLRRALLEHRPISEVRAMDFIPEPQAPEGFVQHDPVLAAAVKYPEALEYLLKRGADPNRPNAFGKTPLMFASQYDQLRAVEILLAHGADPNARTVTPLGNCYYTIQYAMATPLHYAARYASPALIEKLLEGGALPFVEGTHVMPYGEGNGYPIDWFRSRRVAKVDSNEPFLRLLAVPDAAEQQVVVQKLVNRATDEYRAKRVQSAYLLSRNAVNASPEDVSALADFSLIAQRAGHIGESLEASARLLAIAKDSATRANAWFNFGQSCLTQGSNGYYNGRYYCIASRIYPFLQSWRNEPSSGRENKIAALLDSSTVNTCVVSKDGVRRQYWFAQSHDNLMPGPEQYRIYVRHPPDKPPPADAVEWRYPARDGRPETHYVSSFVENYQLTGFAITVLTIDYTFADQGLVEDKPCEKPVGSIKPPEPHKESQYELFKPDTLKF